LLLLTAGALVALGRRPASQRYAKVAIGAEDDEQGGEEHGGEEPLETYNEESLATKNDLPEAASEDLLEAREEEVEAGAEEVFCDVAGDAGEEGAGGRTVAACESALAKGLVGEAPVPGDALGGCACGGADEVVVRL